MDRDFIERLATDRALGALPKDVEQLFDAYVQHDAEAAKSVQDVHRTVGLARTALADEEIKSMPAFPVAGFAEIEAWRGRLRRAGGLAAMAACLVLGLGVGRWSSPTPTAPPADALVSRALVSAVDVAPMNAAQADPAVDRGGYWSIERLKAHFERTDRQAVRQSTTPEMLKWHLLSRSG